MKLSELVRDAGLQGPAGAFTSASTLRLGRAAGTLLRRRGEHRGPVLVGRGGDGAELGVRDGLCQGLVMSGFDVVDLGHVDGALFLLALGEEAASGGALIGSSGESVQAIFFGGSEALEDEPLVELTQLAEGGGFCVGCGSLTLRPFFGGAGKVGASNTRGEA